ncbi:DUF4150 domain-containing protein [Caballeronia sp. LZ029]|uniref:DUF4150 domain-containing protein n=1 Tax=Caballeronia sp. LZ029 TaxID=3038564 RepID=UPI00285D7C78|nr:DUF4150 domain-containing protein [Caballeronia sp. LZ029]MDR5745432.1 DUF4150 domain-containing protein [Caballeronia sp. LZ029]
MSEPLVIVIDQDAADAFRAHYKIDSLKQAQAARANGDRLWQQPNPWNEPPRHVYRDIFDWAADQVVKRFLSGRYKPLKSPQEDKHFSKGNKLAARQSGSFKAVSSTPDVCKTPCGGATPPVPYPVFADLSGSTGVASNVRFNGKSAYTLSESVVPTCTGDEAGCATGVKSGTVGGEVKPTSGSGTVKIGGNPIIRDGDPCTMNNGNCTGTYVTVPPTSGSIDAEGNVVGDTNPPPQKGLLHQATGVVTGFGSAAWDAVKGVGHMAWGATKLTPVSQAAEGLSDATGWYDYHGYSETQRAVGDTVDAIRDNPKAIVEGITRPYIEAWSNGDYGEAIGRGVFDVGGVFVGGIGAVGKGGEVANAAVKAGEAASTASKTAKAASATGKVDETSEAISQVGKAAEIGESGPVGDGIKVQDHGADATESFPLDSSTIDRIRAIPKGERPLPETYMSAEVIESHLSQFDGGASRFMSKSNLEKYGPAQRDGTSFVMTKQQADVLLQSTGGNARAMEEALGLPDGFLDSNELVRVDIPDPRDLGLRIPSGNEAGANDLWIPGGKLPTGSLEAVVDLGNVSAERYSVSPLTF